MVLNRPNYSSRGFTLIVSYLNIILTIIMILHRFGSTTSTEMEILMTDKLNLPMTTATLA